MQNFDINDLKKHCYHDGTVTRLDAYGFNGDFPEDETDRSGLIAFHYYFGPQEPDNALSHLPDLNGADIIRFDIFPAGQGYDIRICVMGEEFYNIAFHCGYILCDLYKYHGMSYKNVYDQNNFEEALRYTSDESYFTEQDHYPLPDGHSLEVRSYVHNEYDKDTLILSQKFGKYTLKKGDTVIYRFLCNYDHSLVFQEFIEHSNGRRYLPYHTDLYGISYFDVDSHEAYDYIPEGYQHDYRCYAGESFIITEVHYDKVSDLVAYGGCYWGGPNEVFVGDLSNPLQYDPYLVNLHNLIDPEYEDIDDIDFVRWEKGQLMVKADRKTEYVVDIKKLKSLIREKAGNKVFRYQQSND